MSSWKIKLLFGKCRATMGQNSDSSMSIYFCAFMLPSMTHIVPTPFQVITCPDHQASNLSRVVSEHRDGYFLLSWPYIRHYISLYPILLQLSTISFLLPMTHLFFAVVVANLYFLSNNPSMIIIFIKLSFDWSLWNRRTPTLVDHIGNTSWRNSTSGFYDS